LRNEGSRHMKRSNGNKGCSSLGKPVDHEISKTLFWFEGGTCGDGQAAPGRSGLLGVGDELCR
jgi:hypothetical protein